MKKILSCLLILSLISSIFAVSHMNNTYQKLANEYAKKAEIALDAGQYADSVEYAKKAEENAALSKAYIEAMVKRNEALKVLNLARNQILWAEKNDAPNTFPMAYTAAKENINKAELAFGNEDYQKTKEYAQETLNALEGVVAGTPLPKYYIVKPWAESKDCYWNISGRPYVYNNPRLWENLYQANKDNMPKPEDPNIINPGMKILIPSINGEYRTGIYDPKKNYNTFGE